jgi:hypothetical protein
MGVSRSAGNSRTMVLILDMVSVSMMASLSEN